MPADWEPDNDTIQYGDSIGMTKTQVVDDMGHFKVDRTTIHPDMTSADWQVSARAWLDKFAAKKGCKPKTDATGTPTVWNRLNKNSAEGQALKERWMKYRGCKPPTDPHDDALYSVTEMGLLKAELQPKAEAFRPAAKVVEKPEPFAPIGIAVSNAIEAEEGCLNVEHLRASDHAHPLCRGIATPQCRAHHRRRSIRVSHRQGVSIPNGPGRTGRATGTDRN
jgi:hypothetical protein